MALSKPINVASYVEEILQCAVCLETVNEPHTLQNCLHTYCKECTDQLQHKQNNHPPGVKCPLCGQFSGKDEIRHNFFIKDLAEMHRSVHQSSHKDCEQCDEEHSNNQASWKCLDCRMLLCDSCKKSHLKIKMLQDHRVLPVTSDEVGDMVVDQLVFCSIHQNKPIELYCKTCNIPICIKCRLTTHDEHKSESIEEALEKIVPEITENTKFIDENMESTKKAMKEFGDKINETKKQFQNCHNKVNQIADERIKEIKREQKRLNDQLTQQENQEVEKLEMAKTNLEKKLKEGENLKRVVLTSLDKARHVTLLNELVQGGLQEKMKTIITNAHLPNECKVNMPTFEPNSVEWNKTKQQGLLGKVIMNITSLIIAMGSAASAQKSFKHFFSIKFQQIMKITLPCQCTRLAMIQNQIWTPLLYQHIINVYSYIGQLVKQVNIANPVSVEEACNGDIFIACDSGSGLHVITDNNKPVRLCDGHFSDVCSFNDNIYALEYEMKSAIEFCHDRALLIKWKQVRKIPLKNYERPYVLDTILVTKQQQDTSLKYFWVSARNEDTIYKYNEQGEQIQKFGPGRKLSYPYLCGVDSQSHLLVADEGNNKCKILDLESGQLSDTGVSGQCYVYDAKINRDGALWLLQHNGQDFIITKYGPK